MQTENRQQKPFSSDVEITIEGSLCVVVSIKLHLCLFCFCFSHSSFLWKRFLAI